MLERFSIEKYVREKGSKQAHIERYHSVPHTGFTCLSTIVAHVGWVISTFASLSPSQKQRIVNVSY